MSTPHFASSVSVATDAGAAQDEILRGLAAGLGGARPDLVAVFATHHHGPALEQLGPRLARGTGAPVVIGCTAESVIGGDQEIEGRPGLAAWGACLPGTAVRPFEITASMPAASAAGGCAGEPEFSGLPPVEVGDQASVLVFADPFTFPVDGFLARMNEELPGVPIMGGMASGASGPGQSLFFTEDGIRAQGAVGVVLEGGIEMRPVVSQGCRPVGAAWVITGCERNLIKKLGGRPALEVLMETWNGLSAADQALMQSAPFVGLAIDATRRELARGDFLVRGVMGLHQHDRAIAVADFVRRGQTIQFLVRDAESAGEDLRLLMASQGGGSLEDVDAEGGAGVLIFSCNGRGCRMFKTPNHDVGCVRQGLSRQVPVAGFFAAGEIGPVGGRNFLHGFTASVAVFRPRITS